MFRFCHGGCHFRPAVPEIPLEEVEGFSGLADLNLPPPGSVSFCGRVLGRGSILLEKCVASQGQRWSIHVSSSSPDWCRTKLSLGDRFIA